MCERGKGRPHHTLKVPHISAYVSTCMTCWPGHQHCEGSLPDLPCAPTTRRDGTQLAEDSGHPNSTVAAKPNSSPALLLLHRQRTPPFLRALVKTRLPEERQHCGTHSAVQCVHCIVSASADIGTDYGTTASQSEELVVIIFKTVSVRREHRSILVGTMGYIPVQDNQQQ